MAVEPSAAVPLDDRGLLLGDGLFETLLFTRGDLVLAEPHARRMAEGAAVLGLPAPEVAAFAECALAAVRDAGLEQARAAVRVTLTAGSGGRGLDRPADLAPRLFATAAAAAKPSTPASLVVAQTRRNQASPVSRFKTLAYLDNVLARREAAAAGADEALMLNTRGEVACAAAANLFWLRGKVLCTPAPECGCLDGVMARQVVQGAAALAIEVQQVRDGPEAVAAAEAILLTNSLIGVRLAYLVGSGRPGPNPVVERLAEAVARFV
ncbi:MAG TPA: aminotransferase class IV, partial [Caulobacteraceae bacterium]|nr:aminotransferase class IV [Caulobacteraceae bacterium]